ncbi:allantoinase AllB [Levilactobacillus parabrevis]|uniref:allantoinase AllB n=1 Tax=Levilactobacillus parabrevis TaxID=357278 RepID=UPI0021A5CF49|nr:allantoinase AllB [Levilactobacillus parabrevis]MCT4488822.1 allantoinase AllB [Levilactobacillus parabrevis]MCT4491634.1 allantoinase AllB [Levilactobacillus parabrevis]
MSHELVIKNGLVILEGGAVHTDVAVDNGKITAIGENLDGSKIVDAKGLVVSPGMVDAHVHITPMGGGYRDQWEGYVTGTASCAKGGVTSFMEMPLNQVPATVDGKTLEEKYSHKDELKVDVGSFGGLVPSNLKGGIQELDEGGVAGYKCFLATCGDRSIDGDFENVDDYSLYEGMKQIAKTGKVLAIHAEDAAITDRLGEIAKAEGKTTLADYVDTRPAFTEVMAIKKAIFMAKQTGCRIHICHVACQEGVDAVIQGRAEGVDVTCETCVHYLYFAKDELDAIGAIVKCSPPIREQAQQDALWKRVESGAISFVTSDHSPCTPDLKDTDNAFDAWGGIPGVQNDVDVMYDEAVQKRGMSLTQFAKITASNPADRYNLDDKGRISVGKDADFVLIKPNAPYTLKAEDLEYRNQISPYIGREIGAQVMQTILRGQTIYSKEAGVTSSFPGKFIEKASKQVAETV